MVVIATGSQTTHPNPFHENLADATDELVSVFDIFIAGKNWNTIFTVGVVTTIVITTVTQQDTVNHGLQTMMKDYNYQLATTLCNAFNTSPMTSYQHLVNLTFVKKSTGCETNSVGHIPNDDVYFPHMYLFGKLATEYFKTGRLLSSSSDNHHTLFHSPTLATDIEAYKNGIKPVPVLL